MWDVPEDGLWSFYTIGQHSKIWNLNFTEGIKPDILAKLSVFAYGLVFKVVGKTGRSLQVNIRGFQHCLNKDGIRL